MSSAQSVASLNETFGLAGVLTFVERNGLVAAEVTLPSGSATVYLHGAHLAAWQPRGQEPVLFLSEHSDFAAGKPIRGGVPVIFPWFGPDLEKRAGGQPGPAHGFARTQEWTVAFAAYQPGASEEDGTLHLTMTLGADEVSRGFGFDEFRLAYELVFGTGRLTFRLSVANLGERPLTFEEALHTYFAVGDVREASLSGLEGANYLDKTDGFQEKTAPAVALVLTGPTDRVFPGNVATTTIADGERTITVAKRNSKTTVVWNPWEAGARGVADLAPDSWEKFLCVETVNAMGDRVELAPGQAHTMEAVITVAKWQGM